MTWEYVLGVTLVVLMYVPYALPSKIAGPILYGYWTIVAALSLVYAWLKTRRW